jgi:hypothetical protein
MSYTSCDEAQIVDMSDFKDWEDIDACRQLGDSLLSNPNILAFRVPNFTSKGLDHTVVLNPEHEDFKDLTWTSEVFKFDGRLWS